MLIPNHPNDERLSALASGDPEALADSLLSEHVASCHRCTDTVAELGALRASLAELPDLRPHRPLQLLPRVTDPSPSRVDRAGGWARRFFAPVLTAGAALAMVGLVGTTVPLVDGMASQAEDATQLEDAAAGEVAGATDDQDGRYGLDTFSAGGADSNEAAEQPAGRPLGSESAAETLERQGSDGAPSAVPDERSVWPMVLFTGVALMVAAVLLRWILAPRPG